MKWPDKAGGWKNAGGDCRDADANGADMDTGRGMGVVTESDGDWNAL